MNDDAVNPQTLTLAQQRVLKWSKRAIIVMSVLIGIGLAALAATVVKQMLVKPVPIVREDALRLLLPQGSLGQVHALSLSADNKLTFAVDSGQGSAIYVVDLATGKMITEIQLVRQGAPVASR